MAANSDIQVRQIAFAPQILCNCPTQVKVTLVNLGTAAPMAASTDRKFEVCLHSPAFDLELEGTYRLRVGGGEQATNLLPGQTLVVTFTNVVFLKPGVQQVTACADCEGIYPRPGGPGFELRNDPHTRPCLKVDVRVIPAAWLAVNQFEIDLEDSLGNRNRSPGSRRPTGRELQRCHYS
jgi:hypothetical protein